MRRSVILILAVCLALAAGQTAFAVTGASTELFAMDTYMTLQAYGKNAQKALDHSEKLILSNEARWSVTDGASEIGCLNAEGTLEVSTETVSLLSRAKELCAYTCGAFDITVYPLVYAWGFTAGNYRIPGEEEIADLLTLVGAEHIVCSGNTVTLSDGARIDVGGIAKGCTTDMLLASLKDDGIESALINLGGNIAVLGTKPDGSLWKIGVQSPLGEGLLGVLSVRDTCVITSGAYERCFMGEDGHVYGHIISPFTGCPAENGLLSVTVITPDGTLGDALSTALFVMGTDGALEFWITHEGFELVLLSEDGTLYVTERISGSFKARDDIAVKTVCVIQREKP